MVITFVKIMGWRVDVDDDALEGEADSSKSQSWQLLIVREGACGIGGYTYAHNGYLTLDACYPVFPLRPAWVRTWRLRWRWLAPCFFWDWTYRWFSNGDWIPSARQLVVCSVIWWEVYIYIYRTYIIIYCFTTYIYIYSHAVYVFKKGTLSNDDVPCRDGVPRMARVLRRSKGAGWCGAYSWPKLPWVEKRQPSLTHC